MGCITSKTVITENPNRFDVIFADTEQTVYYNAQLEINGILSRFTYSAHLLTKLFNYFQEATLYCIVRINLLYVGHWDLFGDTGLMLTFSPLSLVADAKLAKEYLVSSADELTFYLTPYNHT